MGQQIVSGGFRTSPPDPNGLAWNLGDLPAADGSGTGTTTAWSSGATLIDQVPIQPPLGQTYSLIGWTIGFTGRLNYVSGLAAYGRLGRILGGIVRANPTPLQPTGVFAPQPWTLPALPLPAFPLTVLWDGATDPPFPALTQPAPVNLNAGTVINTTILPTPIEIEPGETIQIGLWITPSLTRGLTSIGVFGAVYALVYDDGQPHQTGWGGG